jgi:hypothetical protein
MSVTSATESFTDGAELFEQDKYGSTVEIDLEPDLDNPHQMEYPFNRPLSQRIVPIPSNTPNVDLTRLDDVLVLCPSKAFRNYQKHQWNNVKKEAEEKKTSWSYTAIGTGIFASISAFLTISEKKDVAGYVGAAIANSAPILLLTGAIFTVASVIFIARASSSISQANDQISKWDVDPLLKICKERDEAHNEGFPHIYARRLKLEQGPSYRGRLHPNHVEYEYKKYVKAFCERLLDKSTNEPTAWMKIFIYSNPFSFPAMTYGLGDIPDHMKPVVEDFTRFESFLSDITSSYDRMKSDVRATAKERIDQLTKTRDELALPFATFRDAGIKAAKKSRDDILDNMPSRFHERTEARRDYEIRINDVCVV